MAKTGKERSAKAAAKRLTVAEEELRLRVRPGTRQALLDLMEWAGITEQGEAMTLMIHHLEALGRSALLQLMRHETVGTGIVAQYEELRLRARPGTIRALGTIGAWSLLNAETLIELVIHGIRSMGRHQAVKLLAPPRHEIRLSAKLALEFSRKSLLMIQKEPGDEIIGPILAS